MRFLSMFVPETSGPTRTRLRQRSSLNSTSGLYALALALGFVPVVAKGQVVVQGGTTETVPGTQASPWTIPGDLTVGDVGAGTVNINAGGTVDVGGATRLSGGSGGGAGTINVTGAGATLLTNIMEVGVFGTGTINVQGGGLASAINTVIGANPTGIGSIAVSGSGPSSSTPTDC